MGRRQSIKIGVVLLPGLAAPNGMLVAAEAGEVDRMRISLERSGGFANIPLQVSVDTDALPPDQTIQLRQWIETAQFFDLPSDRVTPMQPDRFQYQITVEEGDRQHSITVSESAMPDHLKPLVQWFTTYARRGD